MSSIEVYNTTNNPVIYSDGKTIAGLEWVVVEEHEVRSFIDEGTLRVRTKPRYAPVIDPAVGPFPGPTPEPEPEISAEDSSVTESVVPSNTAEETKPVETTETVAESHVDKASTEVKPATMRKTRRRKTTPPVKE